MRTSLRRSRSRAQGPAALLALVVLCWAATAGAGAQEAAPPPDAADSPEIEASRVVFAVTTEHWAALALRGGDIVVFDLPGGRRYQWPAPGSPIVDLTLDPMGMGAVAPLSTSTGGAAAGAVPGQVPVILLMVAGPGSGKSTILALRGDTGALLTELRVPGSPGALLVAPGEGLAFALTGSTGDGEDPDRPGRWTLRTVDLSAGKVDAYLTLPGSIMGAAISASGDRIYVGLRDFIRSFTTAPLQSSWMLRSPGANRIIRPAGPSGDIVVARDAQVAVLNPDRLPDRDPETGASPDDDAATVIEIPFIGRWLDVRETTGEAVVLDARGSRLVTVDLERARISRIEQVPEVAAAVFHPVRPSLLLFEEHARRVFEMLREPPDRGSDVAGGPPTGGGPAPRAGAPAPTAPDTGEAPAGTEPGPRADGEPGAPAASTADDARRANAGSPEKGIEDERARAGAGGPDAGAASARADAGAGGSSGTGAGNREEPGAGDRSAEEPDDEGGPQGDLPRDDAPRDAESGQERAVTEPGGPLRGRIEGDLGLVEAVVFYGPDAILKVHQRIRPDPDGSFTLPEPPAGRYRVVIESAGGIQLRCTPPVRQIVVGGAPVEALDFTVAGRLHGRLQPD